MAEALILHLSSLSSGAREYFTLSRARARILRLGLSDRIAIRTEIEAAVILMREAAKVHTSPLRAVLARKALQQLVVASAAGLLKSKTEVPVAWPELGEALRILGELPPLLPYASALAFVASTDAVSHIDDEQFGLASDLFAAVERLVDFRTERDFQVARWVRAISVAVLALCCVWLICRQRNLAVGRIVRASSICGTTPVAPPGSRPLSLLVDGVRREHHGAAACTNLELNPWISVDLGEVKSITEIVAYPRTDGDWGKADVPVQVRISLDDVSYRVVATQTVAYTSDYPLRVRINPTQARFVQLRASSNKDQQIYLNELEVYGR